MTVDVKRLPTLKVLQSYGDAVVAAKMGVNHWDAKDRNVLPLFGIYFLPLVKEFQKAHDIDQTGVIGPRTWAALMPHLSPKAKALLPQKVYVPNLGPTTTGGKSVLLKTARTRPQASPFIRRSMMRSAREPLLSRPKTSS